MTRLLSLLCQLFLTSRASANPSVLTDATIIHRYTHLGRHPFSYSDLTVEIKLRNF